ncbi:hypothetical protein EBU95_02125 [bacterium]|nr:hypothetical protein [bacterium]
MHNILQQPKAKIITNPLIQPVDSKVPKIEPTNTTMTHPILQHLADCLIDIVDTTFLGPINYYKVGLLFVILAFLMELGS